MHDLTLDCRVAVAMTSEHFVEGSFKSGGYGCVEGAISAGCRFYADYPNTASSEIAEQMRIRFQEIGGKYVQTEDEDSSIAAIIGASNGGLTSMALTAAENFRSLTDSLRWGAVTRTPCTIVNVQANQPMIGPLPHVGQMQMIQPKRCSPCAYEAVAYAPSSVQEMFDLTMKAFNIAEAFSMPTFVLTDQTMVKMVDRLVSAQNDNEIARRRRSHATNPVSVAFNYVEDMPLVALARKSLASAVPENSSSDHIAAERIIDELNGEVRNHVAEIAKVEHHLTEDAEIVVIAYGSIVQPSMNAVNKARSAQKKVGLLRLIAPSPFPASEIGQLKAVKIVLPGADYAQIEPSLREHAACPVVRVQNMAGSQSSSDEIYKVLED